MSTERCTVPEPTPHPDKQPRRFPLPPTPEDETGQLPDPVADLYAYIGALGCWGREGLAGMLQVADTEALRAVAIGAASMARPALVVLEEAEEELARRGLLTPFEEDAIRDLMD